MPRPDRDSPRPRYVPLTARLAECLRKHRQAGKLARQGVHVLRHTFCSHLAMRGAPARAIQELAGNQEISTTQRYMHLSPAALDAAIRLLEPAVVPSRRGEILETANVGIGNSRS